MKKRRFHERVWLERKVLGVVNGPGIFQTALTGLTEKAINRWKTENETMGTEWVASLLKEISVKSDLRVDCSKDSFDQDEVKLTTALEKMVEVLEGRVREAAARRGFAGSLTTPHFR
jgi:hypothetical protein